MKTLMKEKMRLIAILNQIKAFGTEDFNCFTVVSEQLDEIDAISLGLNSLGEMLKEKCDEYNAKSERIKILLEIIVKYAAKDFSIIPELCGTGDEIDALAVGLNAVREELATNEI